MQKLKSLSFLLLLNVKIVNAGYLDIGSSNEAFTISTLHHANDFGLLAEKGDIDKVGAAFALKVEGFEIYIGAAYRGDKKAEGFTYVNYKVNRYNYDVKITPSKNEYEVTFGYSYLISRSWGFVLKQEFKKGRTFLGVRKWIN